MAHGHKVIEELMNFLLLNLNELFILNKLIFMKPIILVLLLEYLYVMVCLEYSSPKILYYYIFNTKLGKDNSEWETVWETAAPHVEAQCM